MNDKPINELDVELGTELSTEPKSAKIPGISPTLSEHQYRLMAPGPVSVHPEILKVLAEPQIHHRTPEFQKILTHTLGRLKQIFQTANHVFALTSTGSGAMEAAIVNTLSPGDRVLILEAGKFGERWGHIARQFELSLEVIKTPWGQPVDVSMVEQALREKSFKAVLCQACETSTGVLQPIKEIAALLREEPETLFIVDGITAVGTTPIPMDEWGIDVLIGGSQKAFMLPTGMGMLSLSQKAWTHNERAKIPRFYWDLKKERKSNLEGQTHFSSNVSLIRALSVALDLMLENGLSAHFKRIHVLAQATRKSATELGLGIYSQVTSPSLTALSLPDEVDGQKVRLHLEEKYNVTIAGGQDHLRGKILRIGHMGAITDEDAIETIRLLGRTLHDLYPLIFSAKLADAAADTIAESIAKELNV